MTTIAPEDIDEFAVLSGEWSHAQRPRRNESWKSASRLGFIGLEMSSEGRVRQHDGTWGVRYLCADRKGNVWAATEGYYGRQSVKVHVPELFAALWAKVLA